jgi:hypothetical protein
MVAQIPVVPLPPAPIRPVGRQPESHPVAAVAPWLALGAFAILLFILLHKLRTGQSGQYSPSGWTPWSKGPQVQPVRDPKYWSLIVQAEQESEPSQLEIRDEQTHSGS